jgi:ERCC4-related helicase
VASEYRYQLEVLEKALKENIILYLETGGGKTLIAVLLMKSLAHNLRLKGDKRIAVFLVPTVILVHQVRLFTKVFVEKPWQWCDVCSDLI